MFCSRKRCNLMIRIIVDVVAKHKNIIKTRKIPQLNSSVFFSIRNGQWLLRYGARLDSLRRPLIVIARQKALISATSGRIRTTCARYADCTKTVYHVSDKLDFGGNVKNERLYHRPTVLPLINFIPEKTKKIQTKIVSIRSTNSPPLQKKNIDKLNNSLVLDKLPILLSIQQVFRKNYNNNTIE